VSLVVAGVGGAFTLRGHASTPSDADLFVITGSVTNLATMNAGLSTVGYSIDSGTNCDAGIPVPTLDALVPAYVDVAGSKTGKCTGVTGSGSFTVVGCTTGEVTGSWTIPEPGGDSANFNGAGVIVGGVAVMTAPSPLATSSGYSDDNVSGLGAAVALFLPQSTLGACPNSTGFDLTAIVAGAY
jgi:hypothetical protein